MGSHTYTGPPGFPTSLGWRWDKYYRPYFRITPVRRPESNSRPPPHAVAFKGKGEARAVLKVRLTPHPRDLPGPSHIGVTFSGLGLGAPEAACGAGVHHLEAPGFEVLLDVLVRLDVGGVQHRVEL